jgi:hypothetical protein
MPNTQLTNPTGEEGESNSYSLLTIDLLYDSTIASTIPLNNGNVVVLEVTNQPFVIKKNTTTADFLFIGVVVNAPTGGYLPGQVVEVCTQGITQVLMDANNTTAGHMAVQSATTAGTGTDSATGTLGKTIGTLLETKTIASGTALVWCYVGKW